MKKFFPVALAASLLIPSPILANSQNNTEMTSLSEDLEEMAECNEASEVETMLLDEEIILESSTTNTCKVTFKGANSSNPVEIPLKNNVISSLELIKHIPPNYQFLTNPKDIKKSDCTEESGSLTYSIDVKSVNGNLAKWTAFDSSVPLFLNYKDETTSYSLEFSSWEAATSKDTITKETLNKKLKEVDSSAPYSIEEPVKKGDLTPIFYSIGSGNDERLVTIGYRFDGGKLTKVDSKNLLNRKIKVQFDDAGNTLCELRVGDLVTSSSEIADGKITLTATGLQKALNAMSTMNRNNATFTVTGTSTSSLDIYSTGVEKINGFTVKMALSSQSLIEVNFKIQNQKGGKTFIRLSEIDKNGDRKVTFEEKEKYLQSSSFPYIKLANSQDLNGADWDFTAVNFTGFIPAQTLNAANTVQPSTLYSQPFTIRFIDSETGKALPAETKSEWNKFFRTTVEPILTQENMTQSVLPDGYGIALKQIPNSTATTQEKLSAGSQGNFAISVLNPVGATIYVTKLEGYKENDGHIATKPQNPEPLPVTPQAPTSQPTIVPSQGAQVMYRLYNSKTGEHFYTRHASEKENILNQDGWNDEGHGWTAPALSSYPVYRVFNPNSGEHHYTKDQNEYQTLQRLGWNDEGHVFFSADDASNKVTLYRLYNPSAPEVAKHHYTVSTEERDQLLNEGWKDEGIGWFGMPMN